MAATGGTTTLPVTDELDVATLPALRAQVEQALRDHPARLVIDLSDCGFTGLDAVQALAGLSAQADRQGTELVLLGLSPVVRRVIDLLGLEGRLHCSALPRQVTRGP